MRSFLANQRKKPEKKNCLPVVFFLLRSEKDHDYRNLVRTARLVVTGWWMPGPGPSGLVLAFRVGGPASLFATEAMVLVIFL